MSQAGSRFFLLRPKKCGTALLINTRHATSEGWRRKDPRWCFWKKSNARILMVRLSKTTHMWWLTQYCTASLECYSSLRTHGSRSLVLWPFTSVKHFSVNHIIGVPVDISIHHMWRTDIIHLWASWSSCFLTSDLIKFFFLIIYRTSILLEINSTTLQQMCQMMRFVPKGFRYWHPEHRCRAFYLKKSLFFINLLGSLQYLSLFKWGNMNIYIWNMHIGEDGKLLCNKMRIHFCQFVSFSAS